MSSYKTLKTLKICEGVCGKSVPLCITPKTCKFCAHARNVMIIDQKLGEIDPDFLLKVRPIYELTKSDVPLTVSVLEDMLYLRSIKYYFPVSKKMVSSTSEMHTIAEMLQAHKFSTDKYSCYSIDYEIKRNFPHAPVSDYVTYCF